MATPGSQYAPVTGNTASRSSLAFWAVLVESGASGDIEANPGKLSVAPGGYSNIRLFYREALRMCPR